MTNGVFYGSFNPLHNSHIGLIKEGLEHFDILHIFVRNVPEDDIVDYETKKAWLEALNEELTGKLRIYPLSIPENGIKADGSFDLVTIFLYTEKAAGVHLDGMISGGDKDIWTEALKPAFPEREFIVIPRSKIRSHSIRDNIEAFKDDVPEYVYETLKALKFNQEL